MKKYIKLNDGNNIATIDTARLLESRMVILANSGGGKSHTIRRFVEQVCDDTQTIIIDPEGEFASLRERHDLILCGKGADVPVEVRSASMLALKLLELNKSAVIDLYELSKSDRQRFVKSFFNAMVDAPKALYHPVFIVLDEAHDYAPEGKPSEATQAVEDMASKGRKRGFCLIPASQRVSKLSKNVSAECNNKLIGRASQDLDMKRAGDELGFAKDEIVRLRQLKPGEFFAFGPAISDEVISVRIGDVLTTHAKIGYKSGGSIPPASDAIRKVLAGLRDLPQEAERELKTTAELKSALALANRQVADLIRNQPKVHDMTVPKKTIEDAVFRAIAANDAKYHKFKKRIYQELLRSHGDAVRALGRIGLTIEEVRKAVEEDGTIKMFDMPIIVDKKMRPGEWRITGKMKGDQYSGIHNEIEKVEYKDGSEFKARVNGDFDAIKESPLGGGEKAILNVIAQHPNGISTEHIAVITGYKATSRRTYLQKLRQRSLVRQEADLYIAEPDGIVALGPNFRELPTGAALQEHVMATLPEGERKVLRLMIEAYPEPVSYEDIEEYTGYKPTSRRTYLQKLGARKLVTVSGGTATASDKLFD